jgi:transglutaminase-like putative cysteine protease
MRLRISHRTTYRYDRPVRGVVQSLRLFPSVFEGQRTLDWRVCVSDGRRGGAFRDGAGDWIEGWSVRGPVPEIVVEVAGEVVTTDLSGVLRGHRELVPPEAWLRETAATRPDVGLVALAHGVAAPDRLALAHALSRTVAEAIAYRPGATSAHTTAAEALAQGEGVCQDHAHALIALARLRGLPARYVSGYLAARPGEGAHEAAHAWAEIWVEGLGWVGFDPANACCPDERYVRLGSGRDARDAAPIRGVARSGAEEALEVALEIAAAQQ